MTVSYFNLRYRKAIHGVPIEVDIYIVIYEGTEYESIHLLECKNWDKQKVSPTEIRNFIDKIDAFNANKGMLVSPEYTKRAIKRAEQEHRLSCIKVEKDFLPPFESKNLIFELGC